MKGNWKLTSGNALSLLGAQKKDMDMGVERVGAHSNWNRAVTTAVKRLNRYFCFFFAGHSFTC